MVLLVIFGYMYKWVICLYIFIVVSVKVDIYRVNWLNDFEGFVKCVMKLILYVEKMEELILMIYL